MSHRVLYAPRNISGQASEYAVAVNPFGYEGEVWSYGDTTFGFEADRLVDPDRWHTDPCYRWDLFDTAVRRFDIFHFQYARSLLVPKGFAVPDLWDIPLLKSLGKKVFMHFRGSDVRLKSMHLAREPDSYFKHSNLPCDEDRIRARVAICRRFCDALLVSTPGLIDYVPDAIWVPHVVDVEAWRRPERPERPVPIACHIPSSRGTKHSKQIDAVLRRLAAEGVCTYRSLQGLNRTDVRAALQDADVVVDSLGIGDHGLISVEAMAAGAIAIAHIHERNRARNPGVPVVEATAETLDEVVRRLCADPDERAELRRQGLAWVGEHHDRSVVGKLLVDVYTRRPTVPSLSYPDWPRSETRERVLALEAEVERLRQRLASRPPTARLNRHTLPTRHSRTVTAHLVAKKVRRRLARNLVARRAYRIVVGSKTYRLVRRRLWR